jgi:hypothetical protein
MHFVPRSIHKQKTHTKSHKSIRSGAYRPISIKDGLIGLEFEAGALSRYSSRSTAIKRSSSGGGRQEELERGDYQE